MKHVLRVTGIAVATLLLAACLVTPGKFVSTLDIRADRSFTFTYVGEIIASDMGKGMDGLTDPSPDGDSMDDPIPEKQDSAYHQASLWQENDGGQETGDEKAEPEGEHFTPDAGQGDDARMQAIATALSKEKGFRSVRYMGKNRFEIDYAITGTLDHAFLFPFNIDAQIVLPFLAVELRGDDRVRIKAPGYANSSDKTQGPLGSGGSSDEAAKALNGTFTLTTDAEIVSQNQEDGARTTAKGKQVVWTVTPVTTEAPMAVLRFKGK